MRHGCDAWIMLVQLTSHVVAIGTNTCAGAGEGSNLQSETNRRYNLIAAFADVCELPVMPAARKTMHITELEPGAIPPFRC